MTKAQLIEMAKQFPWLPHMASKTRPEIIDMLILELASQQRLDKLVKDFDVKDTSVIKMFLAQKKLRYDGMSQAEFAKFMQQNMRQANSFATSVCKLSTLGLIFTSVKVKENEDPKVVFPSEYLRFFDDHFKVAGVS
jgi:predicted TPR repeat methyltransferase